MNKNIPPHGSEIIVRLNFIGDARSVLDCARDDENKNLNQTQTRDHPDCSRISPLLNRPKLLGWH